MAASSNRVLAIGLDGYEASLGARLMREGRMENLRRVSERSAVATLEHGRELYSGLTWEHFSTGLSPQRSGRWSAVHFDPARYTVRQKQTQMTPFTAHLPARTVVFDAPYFDLRKVPRTRGLVGWGAHDPGVPSLSAPQSLADEVAARFGAYPAKEWIYGFTWPSPARTAAAGEGLVAAVDRRAEVARWMLAERLADWDLAIVVVSELHSVIEPMWHGVDENHPLHGIASSDPSRDAVERVYEAVDRLIGALAEKFPDAVLAIFAMHGMGPNRADVPAMAVLPELLYRHAFGEPLLRPRADWAGPGPAMLGEAERWEWAVRAEMAQGAAPGSSGARRRRAFLARAGAALLRRLPVCRDRGIAVDWIPAAAYRRHWPRMRAFALPAYYDGRIRLNLAGRESRGTVAPGDYARTCAEIEGLLAACRDPRTGAAAVGRVERTGGSDPMLLGDSEADLELTFEGTADAWEHPALGVIGPLPHRRTGGHTGPCGIAWFSGAAIAPADLGTQSAFDMVPTLFRLLGHDAPAALSGSAIPVPVEGRHRARA